MSVQHSIPPTFDQFFQAATGYQPYGYQCRLACDRDAKTLIADISCTSQHFNTPTVPGTTAATKALSHATKELPQPL